MNKHAGEGMPLRLKSIFPLTRVTSALQLVNFSLMHEVNKVGCTPTVTHYQGLFL